MLMVVVCRCRFVSGFVKRFVFWCVFLYRVCGERLFAWCGIMRLKIIYQDIILFICYYIDKIILFFLYGMGVRISVLYVKNWQMCPILYAKKLKKWRISAGFRWFGLKN